MKNVDLSITRKTRIAKAIYWKALGIRDNAGDDNARVKVTCVVPSICRDNTNNRWRHICLPLDVHSIDVTVYDLLSSYTGIQIVNLKLQVWDDKKMDFVTVVKINGNKLHKQIDR